MSEVAVKVFPHEIDRSWAAENPGAGSDVGEHLAAYTQARIDWAEATQEAWVKQHQAAGLRDEATALLGGEGQHVSNMLRERRGTEWRSRWVDGGLITSQVQVFLGRTSLVLANSDAKEKGSPHARTQRNGYLYTYGLGTQAKRARELEDTDC